MPHSNLSNCSMNAVFSVQVPVPCDGPYTAATVAVATGSHRRRERWGRVVCLIPMLTSRVYMYNHVYYSLWYGNTTLESNLAQRHCGFPSSVSTSPTLYIVHALSCHRLSLVYYSLQKKMYTPLLPFLPVSPSEQTRWLAAWTSRTRSVRDSWGRTCQSMAPPTPGA